MQDYVSITIGHWVVISLILAVLLVYSCSNFLAKRLYFLMNPYTSMTIDYKETLLIYKDCTNLAQGQDLMISDSAGGMIRSFFCFWTLWKSPAELCY